VGEYPELLPGASSSLPALKDEDMREFFFVRETVGNIAGYSVDDIIKEIIKPQPSLKEVFELSLYLFGY
jgi:hypothetical protein